jgi:hypothetical protein
MQLDQTFCVSDCQNFACKTMLSYSKCMEAERAKKRLSHANLSKSCDKYIAKSGGKNETS